MFGFCLANGIGFQRGSSLAMEWAAHYLLPLVALLAVNGGTAKYLNRPDRIVGGEPVPEGDALWQVSIQSLSGHHFCGGTLVAEQWVVTAAHCTFVYSPEEMRVVLGTNQLSFDNKRVHVEKVIRNANYNQYTMENDIALFKLKIDEREECGGIPLSMETSEELRDDTDNCRVTGFGRLSSGGATSDTMMGAAVPLRTSDDCQAAFPAPDYVINAGHVCAGGGDTDACQGDSGGPLVCCNEGAKLRALECRLVGVTSWGVGCATPGLPGVYTKVAHYQQWLEEQMSNN